MGVDAGAVLIARLNMQAVSELSVRLSIAGGYTLERMMIVVIGRC